MSEPVPPEEQQDDGEAGLRIVAPVELGDVPGLYANHVQVTFTPEDFTLHLGWYVIPPLREPPPEDILEVAVRPLLKVTLPLNLVRGVVAVLENQIEAWERSFEMQLPQHPNPAVRAKHTAAGQEEGRP
jgi:hypothetical protein